VAHATSHPGIFLHVPGTNTASTQLAMAAMLSASYCAGAAFLAELQKDAPAPAAVRAAAANDLCSTAAPSPALSAASHEPSAWSSEQSGEPFALSGGESSDSDGEGQGLRLAVRQLALAGARRCPPSEGRRQSLPSRMACARPDSPPASNTEGDSESDEDEDDNKIGLAVRQYVLLGARRL